MKKTYNQPQATINQYEQKELISAVTWNDPTSGQHNDIETNQ